MAITAAEKTQLANINAEIERLKKMREAINPYANLRDLSNKEFGEGWSEPYILSKCPSFTRVDSKGYDFTSTALGQVEVKSSRCPLHKVTYNQLHPQDCDAFLFVVYNIDEVSEDIFLVPSEDLMDSDQFSITAQHDRGTNNCFSMGSTAKNLASLERHRIKDWDALELAAREGYGKDSTR